MKKLSFLIFCFSILILILSLVSFFYFSRPIASWNVYMSFEPTEDTGGFDLNNTALTFGKVPRGSSSMRNMDFDNNYDFPVRVAVNVNGTISPYISYPKEVIFESHERGKISFTINPPFGIENGSYEGFARVYVYKLR